MKLFESKGKELLSKYGIPIPKGVVASSAEHVKDFPYPAVVKAQVLTGGRGKAGGIKFAQNYEEAEEAFDQIIGMEIKGYKVKQVLVEEKLDVAEEKYLSFTIDRSAGSTLLMASTEGGMDVDSVPDERIFKAHISSLLGLQPFILRNLAKTLELTKEDAKKISHILGILYDAYEKEDAELLEVNPLILTKLGSYVAGDAKVTIDDNALYRHPEYKDLDRNLDPIEVKAKKKGISFVKLDGDIGVIANGAGLTMATLDVLNAKGGKGGVFLDLGGTDDPQRVKEAFYLMEMAKPSVILLNIFGGITKCDTVALGVKEALEERKIEIPVVARIKGLHERKAKEILKDAGMIPADTIPEAAEEVVRARDA
ncbi:MAG: ADP-forming succinate--CoA ligase subunit beta [Methanobacteriota archaeon]|nr:MAG: ADP-forming succinate--CoA ligase subunit beta [Euryarchaeota archaeon]